MNRSILSLAVLAALSLTGVASAQNSTPPAGAAPAAGTTTSTSASTSTTTSATGTTTTPAGTTTNTSSGTTTSTKSTKTEDKKNYALTLENACHSESIVLADYEGFKSGDWHWNDPPKAMFHITKILKGPPLNKDIPVRFEFHDHSASPPPPPSGWKFGPDLMPKKGAHFVLFIEHAYIKNGMYDTYEGSYGRYDASEDNINSVYEELNKHNSLEERQR